MCANDDKIHSVCYHVVECSEQQWLYNSGGWCDNMGSVFLGGDFGGLFF